MYRYEKLIPLEKTSIFFSELVFNRFKLKVSTLDFKTFNLCRSMFFVIKNILQILHIVFLELKT